jgi:hypothetical protein
MTFGLAAQAKSVTCADERTLLDAMKERGLRSP